MLYLIFLIASLLFVLLMLFIISSAFLGFLITRVPFVPTSTGDIEFIVKKTGISRQDIFYDLGSGNGKVCFLVEKISGAKTVGFELTWWTHFLAKIKGKIFKSKAKFKNQNFFNKPWAEANVIYGYLYPPLMGRVEEKFKKECKPGSMAIIRDFPFPGMDYKEKYYLPKNHEIYVYKL